MRNASPEATGASMTKPLPRAAIVRGVPDTFSSCLTMEKPHAPIDVDLARKQHAQYVQILKELVQEVVVLPPDNAYPDCPFVEDTAIVVGSKAFVTRPGAISRRGEEAAVRSALKDLNLESSDIGPLGLLDGGDVLFAGGLLLVGRSNRTNEEGIKALATAFPDIPVVTIDVPSGLHLKSALSSIGSDVLAVEDTPVGHRMFEAINRAKQFEAVHVPSPGAANTLRVGDTLLYPSTYGAGDWEKQYKMFNSDIIPVDISEFHKGDGGLTCLSIIIP